MAYFLCCFLLFTLALQSEAQVLRQTHRSLSNQEQLVAKSNFDSNIYEAETEKDDMKSFSAKVSVVRIVSEDTEVMFEGENNKGVYTLPHGIKNYAAALESLNKSKKSSGLSVSITADLDRNIKSVELNKNASTDSLIVVPKDPNQKWDLSKIPH